MPLAQTFEEGESGRDRETEVERLRTLLRDSGTTPEVRRGPAQGGAIPMHECLSPLVPGGVLERGTIIALPPRPGSSPQLGTGPGYLALGLLAGATAGGAWAAAVGFPDLGIAAAAGLGADLSRFLLLDEPGDRWPEAVALLAKAVDIVLLRLPHRPTGQQVRVLTSKVRTTERQRGAVLVVAGDWPEAHLRMRTDRQQWFGLGEGTGHLTGRRAAIVSDGRATRGRNRTADLWLPGADGSMSAYFEASGDQWNPHVGTRPRLRIA